jgi:hypothetical protein
VQCAGVLPPSITRCSAPPVAVCRRTHNRALHAPPAPTHRGASASPHTVPAPTLLAPTAPSNGSRTALERLSNGSRTALERLSNGYLTALQRLSNGSLTAQVRGTDLRPTHLGERRECGVGGGGVPNGGGVGGRVG